MAIINFGSINIDHIYLVPHFVKPGETLSSTDYHSVLGGKGANQSIAAALAGSDVKHVGSVHLNDASFTHSIRASGVDCTHIRKQSSVPTGHAIIQVTEDGENAIVLFPGANHALDLQQIDEALQSASSGDWVLLQNETNAIGSVINAAAEKGLKVAFNPAPMTSDVLRLPLEKVDLLIVNEVEAMQLVDASSVELAQKELALRYPKSQIVLTLGKQGVRFIHGKTQIEVPAFTVEAVDTTAAGDTFIGYFLKNYAELSADMTKAANTQETSTEETSTEETKTDLLTKILQTACAASAISVTRAGAAPSIPHQMEVEAFLKQHLR